MNFKLTVEQDDDPMSPRDWDNVGTMVCFHSRYKLGDEHDLRADNFDDLAAIEFHLRHECQATVLLPLYMYDHSGLTMSTTPFGCRWDSGQVGFVYTTAKRLAEIGVELANAKEVLAAEVAEYDKFLRGEVYGYVVRDRYGDVIDSCWGFFDEDDARSEGEASLRYAIEHEPKPCTQRAPACTAEVRP